MDIDEIVADVTLARQYRHLHVLALSVLGWLRFLSKCAPSTLKVGGLSDVSRHFDLPDTVSK